MRPAILLDSNLLLLLIVGYASLDYLTMHKRLRSEYTVEDYLLLLEVLRDVHAVILTPNTLTETSNLLKHIDNPARKHVLLTLQAFIKNQPEQYISSLRGSTRSEFARLGLTDSVLLEALLLSRSGASMRLLTVDHDLAIAAENAGYDVVNFNHIRVM